MELIVVVRNEDTKEERDPTPEELNELGNKYVRLFFEYQDVQYTIKEDVAV